jgi:hypothetical protein
MKDKPQPRASYRFALMKVDEVYKVRDEDGAGKKALAAAYAYGRRNGWKFCGAQDTKRGIDYMLIRRVK